MGDDAPAVFDPVLIDAPMGRQKVRLWRASCTLCDWQSGLSTGQAAAVAVIRHGRACHDVPLPGEGGGAMPPAT